MFLIISKIVIIQIFGFLFCLGILSNVLFDILRNSFLYNVYINSVIVFSFITGVILCIIKIFGYEYEYKKLLKFDSLSKRDIKSLKVLKPIFLYIRPSSKVISRYREKSRWVTTSTKIYCWNTNILGIIRNILGIIKNYW